MHPLLEGEHRRAIIMGGAGMAAVVALLAFRMFASAGEDDLGPPVDSSFITTPVPPAGAPAPPATAPPVDPALLRDPFCPLVAGPATAPGTPPVTCGRGTPPAGRQPVRLEDVFVEGGMPLARLHVGRVTFPNLHAGDPFGGSFRVVSLSDRCGEFEHAGARFQLCEGEEAFR